MPKQLYKITQFHGGLNSNSDARDIAENELSEATDIMVDELGKIRLMGGISTSSMPAARANQINPGYGLFQFSHDRRDGHTAGAGTEVETDYLALSDPHSDEGQVDIYSNEATNWGNPITGMASNSSGLRADVFYVVDGALRVCDSDFGNSNSNKWYGYIDRTHFSGLTPGGSADTYDAWYVKETALANPPICLASKLDGTADASSSDIVLNTDSSFLMPSSVTNAMLDGNIVLDRDGDEQLTLGSGARKDQDEINTPARTGGNWDGIKWALFPKPGEGFHLNLTAGSGSGGTIPAGSYDMAISYIYDAEPGESAAQESFPVKLYGGGPDGSSFTIAVGETTAVEVFATSPYDPRLTGGRVYWRITQVGGGGDWLHLLDISLKNGVRQFSLGAYDSWSTYDSGASTLCLSASSNTIDSASGVTWEDLNSMSQDVDTNAAKYKTALVANRIAYIGNVRYNGITYGDAVFKSPINKFDVFTDARRLEASINDGDSIVKLETYADRLLVFKKRKLELLNISQDVEFLEDTFLHKGVFHPAATCKTDFGIAWVNREGCYLYDGQKVSNLLEKGGRQIIKESDWNGFTTDNSIIGYVPKKRQIIVLKDCTATSVGDIYLFDLVTQSWIKGDSKVTDNQIQTNFVTDWNGDLVHAHTSDMGTFVKWDDASASSSSVDIETKDIDFGQPAVRKKIYKVYVTHRGDLSNLQPQYAIDGTGSFSNAGSVLPASSPTTAWVTTEVSVNVTSCYSLQLKFVSSGGSTPANFEINDATIVYRQKGIR